MFFFVSFDIWLLLTTFLGSTSWLRTLTSMDDASQPADKWNNGGAMQTMQDNARKDHNAGRVWQVGPKWRVASFGPTGRYVCFNILFNPLLTIICIKGSSTRYESQWRPMTAHTGQCRPTKVNAGQQGHPNANASQQTTVKCRLWPLYVLFSFSFLN